MNLTFLKDLEISAASGLVKIKNDFFVVSDDENSLEQFSLHGKSNSIMLFSGKLPEDYAERKKRKPDLESLCLKKDFVIALPSGSKKNRIYGGWYNGKKGVFSLESLYQVIEAEFSELNIEGSTFVGDELWLFQRGNGSRGENGIVVLDGEKFLKQMITGEVSATCLKSFQQISLGQYRGLNLGFTDACAYQKQVYFLAVVESCDSTYDDGKYLGSVLGKMNGDGEILEKWEIQCPYKPEGLWIEDDELYLVTDADDRSVKSKLYKMKLSGL